MKAHFSPAVHVLTLKSRNTCFIPLSQPRLFWRETSAHWPQDAGPLCCVAVEDKVCFMKGTKTSPEILLATLLFHHSHLMSWTSDLNDRFSALTKSCKIFIFTMNQLPEKGHDARGLLEAFRLNALTRVECQNPGFLHSLLGSEKAVI